MVLTDSELHCNNGQKEIYSLAVVIVYTRITVFRSLTTILPLIKRLIFPGFSLRTLYIKVFDRQKF